MKSMKEMMEELGFNKEAPIESQKAFIKHLIKETYGEKALQKLEVNEAKKQLKAGDQLSFDFNKSKVS